MHIYIPVFHAFMVLAYHFVTGAMRKVPSPDPHTAMPVAKARFFSKYMDTLTIAGK